MSFQKWFEYVAFDWFTFQWVSLLIILQCNNARHYCHEIVIVEGHLFFQLSSFAIAWLSLSVKRLGVALQTIIHNSIICIICHIMAQLLWRRLLLNKLQLIADYFTRPDIAHTPHLPQRTWYRRSFFRIFFWKDRAIGLKT